jgi:hypothetical protein
MPCVFSLVILCEHAQHAAREIIFRTKCSCRNLQTPQRNLNHFGKGRLTLGSGNVLAGYE